MIRLLLLWSAFTLAFGNLADAGELIAFDDRDPPYSYGDGDGVSGIYPALFSEVFKRMKVDIELFALPWTRAISGLDDGKYGIGDIYKTDERLKYYDFSDKLFDEEVLVYISKERPFPFKGVDSLFGKTVGVIRGWSYGRDFDEAVKAGAVTVQGVTDITQSFAMLREGRIDAVLAIKSSTALPTEMAEFSGRFEAADLPLSRNSTYLAFNKAAHKTDLLAKFNATLAAMRGDGSFDKIVASVLTK